MSARFSTSAAVLLSLASCATAFLSRAPLLPSSSSPLALKMSIASRELEAGVSAPFSSGFDPLNLGGEKTFKELKKWRESELKHGRVAMLAVLGAAVQENFHPLFGFAGKAIDGAVNHFQEVQNVAPTFWTGLVFLIAVIEAQSIQKGWDTLPKGSIDIAGIREDYVTGDLGFDPLKLKDDEEKFLDYRTKELNNGRLAMIAALGLAVQELLVSKGGAELTLH